MPSKKVVPTAFDVISQFRTNLTIQMGVWRRRYWEGNIFDIDVVSFVSVPISFPSFPTNQLVVATLPDVLSLEGGKTYVVELYEGGVYAPGDLGNGFFSAANSDVATDEYFISSVECSIPEFVPVDDIGFGQFSWAVQLLRDCADAIESTTVASTGTFEEVCSSDGDFKLCNHVPV